MKTKRGNGIALWAALVVVALSVAACDTGTGGGGGDPVPAPSPSTPYNPPKPGVWTVAYDANGGDKTISDSTVQANKTLTLAPVPIDFTRTGCTFAGWAKSKAGAMDYADGADVPGQAAGTKLTLYALWTVESGQAGLVVAAATSGTDITLTGVAWSSDLKTALESALSGGGISLDLAGVSGLTAWAYDTLNYSVVKDKITSMVLPDTVTSMPYLSAYGAFEDYTNLTSVSGAGVTDIGSSTFYQSIALTEVNLPKATSIGSYAFQETALTTVNLLAATSIGQQAFAACTALADLYLPAAPPTLAANVFQNTGNSGTLSIHVGTTNIGAYTAKWGADRGTTVVAETAADGNPGSNATAYGSGHKAINIVN